MPELTETQKLNREAASVHHMWSSLKNLSEVGEQNMHDLFSDQNLGVMLLLDAEGFANALAQDLGVTLVDRDVMAFWAYKIDEGYQSLIDGISDDILGPIVSPSKLTSSEDVYQILFGGDK